MTEKLTHAERQAIERHRICLCQERGRDVELSEATTDWCENYAVRWREARQRQLLEEQRAEIERHKWIESEKAGHDLGRDAVMDWIKNNAAAWRQWYEAREVHS